MVEFRWRKLPWTGDKEKLQAENTMKNSRHGLRRRRGASNLLTQGGGPLSITVMVITVAGLLVLLVVQGTFYLGSRRSSSHRRVADVQLIFDAQSGLRGKQSWDTLRDAMLQTLQTQNEKDICLLYNSPSRSGSRSKINMRQLWTQYIGAILAASKHPDDPEFLHEDWTKRLLAELPPSSLQSTLHSSPPHASVSHVLEIVRHKLVHPETAPPLRIAVLGGSVTEGAGCDIASVLIPEGSIMANPSYCAWPYRLEAFLNNLVGFKWVQVTNMAEEGTDTGFMTPLLKNWIYPPSLLPHGPDIVVNAYGRNDYSTYEGEATVTLEQTIQSELQTFVRAVETSHPCGVSPLIIHMDDTHVDLVGSNVLAIRHGDAVQKVRNADLKSNDAPFTMASHMAMAWVLAYNMMEVSLQHCLSRPTMVTPKLVNANTTTCRDASTGETSCPFAIFISPMGTVRKVPEVQKYIQPFVAHNVGWQVLSEMSTGWSRKTGLVATMPNAHIVFKIPNITKEIRYFHLMTLKSNGVQWQGGKARFRLAILPQGHESDQAMETTFDIDGFHESDNHITYHFSVDFESNRATIGSDVMMSVELVEGSSFKILGLMLCS